MASFMIKTSLGLLAKKLSKVFENRTVRVPVLDTRCWMMDVQCNLISRRHTLSAAHIVMENSMAFSTFLIRRCPGRYI